MDRYIRFAAFSFIAVAGLSMLPVDLPQAAGDGTIVLQRTVQPRMATRPTMVPDPNPITVNPNISPQVQGLMSTTELDDGDFAQVTSGSTLTRHIMPAGHIPGLNAGSSQSLPGAGGGSAPGASGNAIANQVNSAVKQGLAPLQALTGGR
ncbi:hypothetical protein [Zestomonas thermotolerans]|jgi:hypothetical protein|uniref:hypothetical protein n=1 Tax=Zestomonas thermotolerans TaxID=157784 RepID=UPI0023F0DA6B|nr:hypothetical protein [Pseudomonas thermotolerans]MBO2510637.1 hypothetical protein [Gammaproteobacteria bacterium]